MGRGGRHQIFQNEGKRESEGAECRVKRGHLIYWPWGKVLARPAVGLQPLSAPRAAPVPLLTQEFGACILPKLPHPALPYCN